MARFGLRTRVLPAILCFVSLGFLGATKVDWSRFVESSDQVYALMTPEDPFAYPAERLTGRFALGWKLHPDIHVTVVHGFPGGRIAYYEFVPDRPISISRSEIRKYLMREDWKSAGGRLEVRELDPRAVARTLMQRPQYQKAAFNYNLCCSGGAAEAGEGLRVYAAAWSEFLAINTNKPQLSSIAPYSLDIISPDWRELETYDPKEQIPLHVYDLPLHGTSLRISITGEHGASALRTGKILLESRGLDIALEDFGTIQKAAELQTRGGWGLGNALRWLSKGRRP